MPDATQAQPEDETTDTVTYASFILRCWTGPGGQIRVRLIDVQTGVSRPVADLAGLPEQVRDLMDLARTATCGTLAPTAHAREATPCQPGRRP